MLISEAFELYAVEGIKLAGGKDKTVRNYRSACNSLLSTSTDIPIALLTLEHLNQWKRNRARFGHASSSIAHDLSRLKQVLKYLKRRGLDVLDHDLIDSPKVTYKPRTYLIAEQVQEIINVIESPRDRAIFACMFDTGARVSELLNLNRDDLRGNVAGIIGKGDKPGELYFSAWSLGYLKTYLATRKDAISPMFISSQRRRITVSRVEQLLHVYTDLAGIKKNVTPHVLRHSFATDLRLNGADIYDIKEQLRHEKISSTEIYVHIDNKTRRQNHARFHTNLSD